MNTDQLAAQLTSDEGLRTKVYTDTVGKLTVGVGRNISDRAFSADEIALMLKNDIAAVCSQLDKAAPWWSSLSERRKQALANFTFNVGIGTALTFKNTMQLLQSGQYTAAADEMMRSKWASQVGARAVRITTMIREG